MPAHARRDIIPPGEVCVAHVWSRCVQRAFLCGFDEYSGVDYSHRREPIRQLLRYQASVFAVEVGNYNILHNHKHAILRARPDLAANWSDEEVAWRWKMAWPSWDGERWDRAPDDREVEELLNKSERIPKLRANLSDISWYMARWKEPLAKLFNAEFDRRGHFFEQRFGSRLLEDEEEVLGCSLYLDTNQTNAGAADSLEESDFSAIQDRIRAERIREARLTHEELRDNPEFRDLLMEFGDLESLYADCWLSPIALGTPLSTQAASKIVISEPTCGRDAEPTLKTSTTLAGESGEFKVAGEREDVAPSDVASPPRDSPRELPRPPVSDGGEPTFHIHRRLRQRALPRASDQCFLPMPWRQYLALSEWAARRFAPSAPVAGEKSVERTAAAVDDTPTTWRSAVLAFQAEAFVALRESTGAIAGLAAAMGLGPQPRGDPDP